MVPPMPEWFEEIVRDAHLDIEFGQTSDPYGNAWRGLCERGELRWRTAKAPQWLWNGEPPAKDGERSLVLMLRVNPTEER